MALDHAAARLQALSPRATLVARLRDRPVRTAGWCAGRPRCEPGARIDVELAEGGLGTVVDEVRS